MLWFFANELITCGIRVIANCPGNAVDDILAIGATHHNLALPPRSIQGRLSTLRGIAAASPIARACKRGTRRRRPLICGDAARIIAATASGAAVQLAPLSQHPDALFRSTAFEVGSMTNHDIALQGLDDTSPLVRRAALDGLMVKTSVTAEPQDPADPTLAEALNSA